MALWKSLTSPSKDACRQVLPLPCASVSPAAKPVDTVPCPPALWKELRAGSHTPSVSFPLSLSSASTSPSFPSPGSSMRIPEGEDTECCPSNPGIDGPPATQVSLLSLEPYSCDKACRSQSWLLHHLQSLSSPCAAEGVGLKELM